MKLYQFKHFVAVVETGSFTKGGQHAAVSQPALSASIAKLETELGVKLLDRHRSRVVLTPAGDRFLETAKSILLACNTVKAELKCTVVPKPLRIGILQTLSTFRVAKLLSAYMETKPNTEVQLFDASREDLLEQLSEQRLDVIITSLVNDGTKFTTRPLFKEPYILAISRHHRFARENSVKLADLESEPFIIRTSCETFQQTSKVLESRGIKTRIAYQTDQDDRALALVAAGVGISLFPTLTQSPDVIQVRVRDFDVVRTIGIQWYDRFADEHLKRFITFTQNHDWRATAPE
ncbi:LysR family transcriptional regulator [Bradyrhizobium sp. I71]|uniref:LysR family transcriptional regulator n=1 Tax=Bradyrhizobium sp. I71 TaxID=2590772 RepID=UPI001EF870C1|nr:LysR family transcriptional regulator [Bradyrhizobium sp. I71]ULK98515.1 LysR family transcriptional regulator [Bradyrhizobium sp. I71]